MKNIKGYFWNSRFISLINRGERNIVTKTKFENEEKGRTVGVRKMGEIVMFIDDMKSISGISRCRICHEEEFESSKSLEAPCACSGTVKVNPENCGALVPSFLNHDFSKLIALFHCSVCSQRLHSEMVQWEREYNLWNMSPGMNVDHSFSFLF